MMEVKSALGRITLGVGSNKTMLEILNSNILHVETNIVIGKGLLESFMVHLYRLNFIFQSSGDKCHNHPRLRDTSLNPPHKDSSNTTNLVEIPERKMEGLV